MQFFIVNANALIYYERVDDNVIVSLVEQMYCKINFYKQHYFLCGDLFEKHFVINAIKSSISVRERFMECS